MPAIFFHVLFVFVVLAHALPANLSIDVTSSATATSAANRIVQAFPRVTAPRYLLGDRDGAGPGSFDTGQSTGYEREVSVE